ncbi:MAG: cation:proton antiporter [Opitutales bacterium]
MIFGLSMVLCLVGAFFFFAGTVGLLRFPDTLSRLHALTKADNLGLGFLVAGMAVASQSWVVAGELLLIWLVTMLGGTTNCYLMAQAAVRRGPAREASDTPEPERP